MPILSFYNVTMQKQTKQFGCTAATLNSHIFFFSFNPLSPEGHYSGLSRFFFFDKGEKCTL